MRTIPSLRLLPLLLAAACSKGETGIDRTFIRGTLEIPADQVSEDEPEQGANEDTDSAADLGYIVSRYTVISGVMSDFAVDGPGGPPVGDLDNYRFSSLRSGTLTLWLDYEETGGEEELTQYYVAVYDLDNLIKDPEVEGGFLPTTLVEGSSAESFGHLELAFDVEAGGNYAIFVGGTRDGSDGDGAYTLTLSGFDPNEERFLVGAYPGGEVGERGSPVGGTDVRELTLDPETLTWSGPYEITYVYGVSNEPGDDTDDFPTITPEVGLTDAFLFAGNFASLNAGLTSGTLFSSEPVALDLSAAKEEDIEDGLFGTGAKARVLKGVTIAADTIQPKVYGWTAEDTEPNEPASDDPFDPTGVQETPEATGPGVVDVITGALDYDAGDIDYYAITVPETLNAFFTMAYADNAYNIDMYLLDSTGADIANGWELTGDSNPESFNASQDWEFLFEPGETYYLLIAPYLGDGGAVSYTVEIEWLAP